MAAALGVFGVARAQAPAGSPTYNVLNYGAVADGVTDNYAAFQRLAAAVSPPPFGTGTGKGTIVFPPGVYKINQYRILGGAQRNSIQNIYFRNCNGLTVTGTGATISVTGSFYRSLDYTIAPDNYSYRQQVVPLYFYACQNFVVDGFELNGNVGDMTKDPTVVEGTSYGLATEACSNYTIKNINTHLFASDGLMIGASSPVSGQPLAIADRNGTITNVHAYNNARVGLSVYQARGISFTNCVFETSGVIPGSYGGHLPFAGAGIEPERQTVGVDVDVKTGDISFVNCAFNDNVGMQWFAGGGDRTVNVTLDGCTFTEGPHSVNDYTVLLAVNNGIMQNCTMRGKRLSFVRGVMPNVTAIIRNNKLYSNSFAIVADGLPATALIDNNDIIGTYTGPTSNITVYLQNMPNVDFVNNRVFVPTADKSGTGGQGVIWLNNIHSSQNNTYTTDLTGVATSHFNTTYTACPTYQDHYNSGTYFRPAFNSTFNTANPYSTVTGAIATLLTSVVTPPPTGGGGTGGSTGGSTQSGGTKVTKAYTAGFGATANQAMRYYLPANSAYWGALSMTVTGGYNGSLAAGRYTKEFSLGLAAGGTVYEAGSQVTADMGVTSAGVSLTGPAFDSATGRWYFSLVHREASLNNYTVQIVGQPSNASYATAIQNMTSEGPVSQADPGKDVWSINNAIKTDAAGYITAGGWSRGAATLDFPSLAAGASADLNVTTPGAVAGDPASAAPTGAPEPGIVWSAYVATSGVVTVRASNQSATTINPAARVWETASFSNASATLPSRPTSVTTLASTAPATGSVVAIGLSRAENTFSVSLGATANQAMRFYLPASTGFYGTMSFTVAGGWNGSPAQGHYNKAFSLGLTAAGALYEGSSQVVTDLGQTTVGVTLVGPNWDAGSSRWFFSLVHREAAANNYTVTVTGQSADTTGIAAVKSMTLEGPVAQADPGKDAWNIKNTLAVSQSGAITVGGWARGAATLDFPSIPAGSQAELTMAAPGAGSGDVVAAAPGSGLEAGLAYSAYVPTSGSVTVRVLNTTASAIDPVARVWKANTFAAQGLALPVGPATTATATSSTNAIRMDAGSLTTGACLEGTYTVPFVAAANQEMRFYLPAGSALWGTLAFTITGGYQGSNALGRYVKQYSLGLTGAGAVYEKSAQVVSALGNTANGVSLVGPIWNSASGRWYFSLVHREAAANTYTVHVAGQVNDPTAVSVLGGITVEGPIAAADPGPDNWNADSLLTVNPAGLITTGGWGRTAATLDFPSIAAKGAAELTVTVPGAQVGDAVSVSPNGAAESGLVWSGYISAANTATVRVGNVSAVAVNPAARVWQVSAFR
ncbi:MAG TPA: glycosyl hydrolase family 28-related protein [Armatimonadota bacterium]|jgi:hypothetical protein